MEVVVYLHKNGIAHRDIKPDNIILNKEKTQITLIDFNISKRGPLDGHAIKMMTRTGTPHFKAPEMLRDFVYDERVDEWMVGCVIYYMATGRIPFNENNEAKLNKMILEGAIETFDIEEYISNTPAAEGL